MIVWTIREYMGGLLSIFLSLLRKYIIDFILSCYEESTCYSPFTKGKENI